MPTYYFHLRDGEDVLLDPDGRELASSDKIPDIAMWEARSIISSDALSGRIELDQRIDVEDSAGVLIHRLPFCDAIEIVP